MNKVNLATMTDAEFDAWEKRQLEILAELRAVSNALTAAIAKHADVWARVDSIPSRP